jgi:RNase H-fold protein (predicted Holliday junction resolvase)
MVVVAERILFLHVVIATVIAIAIIVPTTTSTTRTSTWNLLIASSFVIQPIRHSHQRHRIQWPSAFRITEFSPSSSSSTSPLSMSSSLSINTQQQLQRQRHQLHDIRLMQEAASNYTRSNCAILGTKSIGVDYGCVRTGLATTVGFNPKPLDIITVDIQEEDVIKKRENDDDDDNDKDDDRKEENNLDKSPLLPPLDPHFLALSSEISMDHLAKQFPLADDDDESFEVLSQEQEEERHGRRLRFLQKHQQLVAKHVIDACRREGDVQRIVVGLPLHKNGTDAEQSMICRLFAAELARQSLQNFGPSKPVDVWLWDERYTSKEAAARAHSINPNQGLYGMLDADAACIILEHFYNDHIVMTSQSQAEDITSQMDEQQQQLQKCVNGELVTVTDPELIRLYTEEWNRRQRQQQLELQQATIDRETRLLLRKQRIEEDRQHEIQQQEQDSNSNKKRNTKKKRKKK